jgi:FSR family fosmidomycin resistance protein-like MFS transporter
MNRPAFLPGSQAASETTFAILFAVSFAHLLNDMMQALLPAIYPTLKSDYHLDFAQIGLVTFAFQFTA